MTREYDIMGIFTTKDKALLACKDYTYFVGPLRLDEEYPEERCDWEGVFYPITFNKGI